MQYNPRQRLHTSDLEYEIGAYGGEEVTPRNHRPARNLGNLDQAIIQQRLARQQAIDEARARKQETLANARQNRATNSRRVPGQRSRYTQANDEEGIDGEFDDVWPPVLPSSAIRHTLPPEGVYRTGNKRLHVEYIDVPPRASAQPQRPPAPQQQTRNTNDIDELETQRPRNRRNFQIHWFVFVGIALLLMIGGWIAFNDLGVWWQNHQDDVTYGTPRTFQTDAVVGHNDSNSSPSHFIAINLRGQIYVIELPGGDATKARGYYITSEVGNDANPPVKVSFQDIAHSGRLDMVVTIGDPPNPLIVFLFNNGSQFAAKAH
jgi:hypothetical protein